MPDTNVTPDRDIIIIKNMSNITKELNTDSDFGVGVVTGNQQIESDGWWKKLCGIVLCCSCGGGGGGATQMKRVD